MAGRIPRVQQEVAPTGPRVSAPVIGNEADASSGIRALGQAAAAGASLAAKFEAEADSVRITESLVDLERRANERLMGKQLDPIDAAFEGTSRTQGFLQVRGTTAGQASRDVVSGLGEDLQEIADKLLPRQRDAFMQRAQQLQFATERRITEHVVRESERAKVDVLQAAKSETIRAIGEDPMASGWAIKSAMVEESIRALATSPEGAEAAVADWKGQVALQQISSFLKSGDTPRAEERFQETRDVLGAAADDVEALIARSKLADGKKQLQVAATAQTQEWVKAATPGGGYVDASKVLLQLEQTPADDPRREFLEVEVRQALQVQEEKRKADTQKHRENAWRADLNNQQMPPASFVFLEQFDPDFLRGLKNEREARWRRWKADKDGTAAEAAAARRQQALDDRFLADKFAALPPEEQAKTTPEEYSKVLAAEFPDFSPSRNGYAATEKHRAETVQRLGKGDLADEQRFMAEAERETLPLVVTKKKGKDVVDPRVQGDPRSTISGNAAKFYRSKRAALGRDPTPDEAQKWLGEFKLQPEVSFGRRPLPAGAQPDFLPGGYGAPLPAKPAVAAPPKTQRQAAESWLSENPNHPKAASVRAKLEAMK